jgi:hypothetical protein
LIDGGAGEAESFDFDMIVAERLLAELDLRPVFLFDFRLDGEDRRSAQKEKEA